MAQWPLPLLTSRARRLSSALLGLAAPAHAEAGWKRVRRHAADPQGGAKVPVTLRDPRRDPLLDRGRSDRSMRRSWGRPPDAIGSTRRRSSPGASRTTSALFEASVASDPQRHLGLLLGAGLATSLAQWVLTPAHERQQHRRHGGHLVSRRAGRMPAWRTLGTAVLSIVIVGMGAPARPRRRSQAVRGSVRQSVLEPSRSFLGRPAPPHSRDRAPGRAWPRSTAVPCSAAPCLRWRVLRGALALRLVVPALAAAGLIATKTASFVVPNAPLYERSGLRNLARRATFGRSLHRRSSACGQSRSSG